MAYKFQRGEAILSGALLQEGSIEIESGFEFSMHDELVLDTSRNLTVAGMSGSGNLEVGGTVRLDGVDEADAVATDKMYFLDSDGLMKADAIEDVRDFLIFDSVSGDATIAHGGALTIAAGAVENSMLSGGIASDKIAELNAFDTADLAEGSNLYFTDARARAAVSVTDAGGDGSLTYDSGSGVFTFTGPSASEVRAHLSVTDNGGDGALSYDSSTGVISYTGPSADEVRAHLSTGYMIDVAAGQFSIDALEFSGSWADVLATKDTGDLAEGSNLYYTDARVHAALSVSDSNSIDMTYDAAGDFSAALRISGSQLEVTADGLRLAALAADGTTMELSSDSLSVLKVPYALSQGEGISVFSFDGSSDVAIGLSASVGGDGLAYSSGVLSLDLDELTAADVNVTADFIAIVDADDNSTKKESIADLVAAMAGAGLTATDGVLKVTGNDVHSKADGDTLQEGYNYFGDASADAAVTLPASPSDGDVVHVKAGNLTSDAVITISAQGSHNIDSEASIVLESPFAAVSLVYVGNNDWRIV